MNFPYSTLQIQISKSGIKPLENKNFTGGVFNNDNYKIYVLKDKDAFVYVGKTKQAIGTKLRQGFYSFQQNENNNRQGHYGGYKWIKKYMDKTLRLFVFDLGNEFDNTKTEAVEAELVYLIRKTTGKWPLGQNEIHFYNHFEKAKEKARHIFNSIMG